MFLRGHDANYAGFPNMASSIRRAVLTVVLSELDKEEKRRKTRRRRWWVRDVNRRYSEQEDFVNLVQELRNDGEQFYTYFRMNRVTFHIINASSKDAILKMFDSDAAIPCALANSLASPKRRRDMAL